MSEVALPPELEHATQEILEFLDHGEHEGDWSKVLEKSKDELLEVRLSINTFPKREKGWEGYGFEHLK